MMCPHCMQDSNPAGEDMSLDTFNKVLQFLIYCKVPNIVLSGGEPTMHKHFDKICQALNNHKLLFTICSNGSWCTDDRKITEVYGVLSMEYCSGMQVYSNPKWYKDYELIVSKKDITFKHPKISVETTDIRSMQDLGRAKTNLQAQKEVDKSPYFMSCLNGALMGKQTRNLKDFFKEFINRGILCKPLIDCKGTIHLSESWLCPECGNINTDSYLEIWNKIKEFKPCLLCKGGKKFLASQRLDILMSKKILNINEQETTKKEE